MASTPPPLPSDSDDSEFDDDDFGCFKSSVTVTAPSSVVKQPEPNYGENSVHENDHGVEENESDEKNFCSNANAAERSDVVYEDDSKEQLTISNEEALPKDESPINQLEAAGCSFIAAPENHTSEEEVHNGISNISDPSQSLVESSEDNNVENDSAIAVKKQEINEVDCSVEAGSKLHSKYSISDEEENLDVEQSEELTDSSLSNVVNNCCENVSEDTTNVKFSENLKEVNQSDLSNIDINNDSQKPADLPVDTCLAEDTEDPEEDEFGDWGEVTDSVEKEEHEKEMINKDSDINNGDMCETRDDVSLTLQDDVPDIPSEIPNPEDNDHCQNSLTAGDDDEDDDFGDFADFSSHQELKNDINTAEDNIPPISFRTASFDANSITNENSNDVTVKNCTNESTILDKSDIEGDDDDDWGFKSANIDGNGDRVDNDDFGNFGSADDNGNGGDWASFNEPSIPAAASENVDDDDFSDFSGNDLQSSSISHSPSSQTLDGFSKVEKVVALCFPSFLAQSPKVVTKQNEENSDEPIGKSDMDTNEIDGLCTVVEMGIKITPKTKEETWTIVKEIRNKDPIVGTWSRLKDVNSSCALDYGWNNSYCCQEVFSTLHIDTKNVLFSQKKQAVPFYTTGLGILEPIRGGGPNPGDKNQPTAQPTLLDTAKPEEANKVLDIPPVDFDWGSSGLTNPLKVFKNESFNTGLSSLEPFSDALQKNAEHSKKLSDEAKSILSKIPNLNFMRSNVLMFPIKD